VAAIAQRPADAGLPTEGRRGFHARRTPTHRHQGIDLLAPKDAPVYAVRDGVVTHASSNLEPGFSGYGGHIVLKSDTIIAGFIIGKAHGSRNAVGPWFLYAHLDSVAVRPGQRVKQGQVIGRVGNTCYTRADPHKLCKGAHLHFEVSPRPYPQDSEATRLDPVVYLSKGEVASKPAQVPSGASTLAAAVALPLFIGVVILVFSKAS